MVNDLTDHPSDDQAPRADGAVDVLLAQSGPEPWVADGGCERLAAWLAPALAEQRADLVVLNELATTPFFSVSGEKHWLEAGQRPHLDDFAPLSALARESGACMVVPFAERGELGELYNSALILGSDGEIVTGRYCTGPASGQPALTYRKVHLSENRNTQPGVHEKYFFRPGDGFVTFDLPFGRVAILICYDRSFPEAWRAVRLAGARFVVVPVGSSRPERAQLFGRELQIGAVQNGVFVLSASKGGTEQVDDGAHEVTYFGASQAVTPFGEVVASGPLAEGPALVRARLDLELLDAHDRTYHFMRDRRPDTY